MRRTCSLAMDAKRKNKSIKPKEYFTVMCVLLPFATNALRKQNLFGNRETSHQMRNKNRRTIACPSQLNEAR